MSRPDHPKLVARDFLGLSTSSGAAVAAPGASMDAVQQQPGVPVPSQLQHLSRKQYADAIAAVKSNIMEGVQGPNSVWPSMYANNNNIAFQGLGQTDWNGGAFSRRQVLPKGERLDEIATYAAMPTQDHLLTNFVTDHSGTVVKKVFPFLSPVNHNQHFLARVQPIHAVNDARVGLSTPLYSSHVTSGATANTPPRGQLSSSDIQSTTQLTIFYGGSVNVYNNVSVTKAQEIMLIAAAGGALPSNPSPGAIAPFGLSQGSPEEHEKNRVAEHHAADQGSANSRPATAKQAESTLPNIAENEMAVPRALPQARKASLARFLERRKERVQSRAPYLTRKPSFDESSSNFSISTPAAPTSNDCLGQRLMSLS